MVEKCLGELSRNVELRPGQTDWLAQTPPVLHTSAPLIVFYVAAYRTEVMFAFFRRARHRSHARREGAYTGVTFFAPSPSRVTRAGLKNPKTPTYIIASVGSHDDM